MSHVLDYSDVVKSRAQKHEATTSNRCTFNSNRLKMSMHIYANEEANSHDLRTGRQISTTHQTSGSSDGWIYNHSSFYYISSEKKSWNESRRYCTERGADLIIINNKEERDFVEKNIDRRTLFWIGLTDIDEEGSWKWVDGSTPTFWFWRTNEPNGQRGENCAVVHSTIWADYRCSNAYPWICEKNI
ncbi:C-type lectin domain family 17, member A-like [Megalobrama amblycephala]|uniref:C-type lectin domain family 17, member A-like n=1 Tax=Megalobrama amblycephala TaxID=75352 RepID=UPI00201446B7|nr:C-type lectin domain family 17, member A-like [Megalobrama amblycephala]